jgi:uncharacterized protein YciI
MRGLRQDGRMTVFAVQYRYDDRTERRDEVRPEHRAFLADRLADGSLLASGPYAGDGAPGALLIVSAGSAAEVDQLLDADPFVREGIVADRAVREWTPVFGPWA